MYCMHSVKESAACLPEGYRSSQAWMQLEEELQF